MLTIRIANVDDEDFIRANAYRLLEFCPPVWRDNSEEEMTQADIGHILGSLRANHPDRPVMIANDASGTAVGFIHLTMAEDYYTRQPCAHLIDIVVISPAEGKGVGKFLLQKAEEWAVSKNSPWITLNAFEGNRHARAVYEKVWVYRRKTRNTCSAVFSVAKM